MMIAEVSCMNKWIEYLLSSDSMVQKLFAETVAHEPEECSRLSNQLGINSVVTIHTQRRRENFEMVPSIMSLVVSWRMLISHRNIESISSILASRLFLRMGEKNTSHISWLQDTTRMWVDEPRSSIEYWVSSEVEKYFRKLPKNFSRCFFSICDMRIQKKLNGIWRNSNLSQIPNSEWHSLRHRFDKIRVVCEYLFQPYVLKLDALMLKLGISVLRVE
jgi:hypothetical protein